MSIVEDLYDHYCLTTEKPITRRQFGATLLTVAQCNGYTLNATKPKRIKGRGVVRIINNIII